MLMAGAGQAEDLEAENQRIKVMKLAAAAVAAAEPDAVSDLAAAAAAAVAAAVIRKATPEMMEQGKEASEELEAIVLIAMAEVDIRVKMDITHSQKSARAVEAALI